MVMVGVFVPLLNMDGIDNRPFPSCPLPLCHKQSSRETCHMEICSSPLLLFILYKLNTFSIKRFCTRTCFETEAQGNLEMGYWIQFEYFLQDLLSKQRILPTSILKCLRTNCLLQVNFVDQVNSLIQDFNIQGNFQIPIQSQ